MSAAWRRTLRAVVLVAAAALLSSCARKHEPLPPGVLVISQEQQAAWVRNFNPFSPAARWPTRATIYEPLFVFNSVESETIPWLATGYEWRDDNLTLRIFTRDGVLWSDGEPFSAYDVEFTLNIARDNRAADGGDLWGFLADVQAIDERTVDFKFQRVFVPGFDELAMTRIVPKHIWEDVEDPIVFSNENPVGTGPFTEVGVFRTQIFEVHRNPHYWQEGKPAVKTLRFPAYSSNDRANLALVFDEVDWAGNFIPAIDRVYVGRNPETHHYWFPLTGSCIFLYANTTRAPFDNLNVRRALSMAIDRQLLVDIAVHRYSRPADATGLSDAYTAWRNADIAAEADWMEYDPELANRILDEEGYPRGEDGIRRKPNGEPLQYDILTVSGWSDWVRASQVIAGGYRELGIVASVKTPDFSAWFQRVQQGDFDLSMGWSYEGPTPYSFYRWLMSSQTVRPEGETAVGNWHRYSSPSADEAMDAFELATELEDQRALANDMQRVFVAELPAIPLYPNPAWAEFNTSRFTGFPTADNPYANPSPNKADRGEVLLVLNALQPR